MKHFEEIRNLAINCVKRIQDKSSQYYIVRDVFGRISIYVIGGADLNSLQEELRSAIGENWINRVTKMQESDRLFGEVSKNVVSIEKNIFYSERHLVKKAWSDLKGNVIGGNGKVITFYSYKGGVGRTTTLALTALQMVREGKKVVVVDFDLEAPGLSTLLRPETDYPKYGVIDFLLESENSDGMLDINDYLYPVSDKKLVGLAGGELLVMQAANLETGDVNEYYNKLSRIDFNMPKYLEDENTIKELIKSLKERFNPDFIFIDSRAGIHDIGGLTLFRYSDEVVPIFYGNQQNMLGLKFILPKLVQLDIPFYLVNSPMPVSEEDGEEELNCFLKNSIEILDEVNYFTDIPDIFDESSPHYPINISYDILTTNINSPDKIYQILSQNGEENVYKILGRKLAINSDKIDECKFDEDMNKEQILKSIENIIGDIAAAENEFPNEESLVKNFYPLKEYRYIFDNNKFLITGAKGSGKTALFRVLKCPEYARRLARYVDIRSNSIEKTEWIIGLDQNGDFPTQANFGAFGENENREIYSAFWKALAVRVMEQVIKEHMTEYPSYFDELFSCKYSKLKDILKKNESIDEELTEFFISLDEKLAENDKIVIISYDALDSCIANRKVRGAFISELINLWFENNIRLKNIKAKIFLRNDIFKNEVTNITDKIKLNNYRTIIDWDYDHLLAMVWKRMLEANKSLKEIIENTLTRNGYSLVISDDVGIIPRPDSEINRLIISEIVGEKMGKGNKAYTYNWISYRLSDTNDRIVPRSMLKLFSLAAKNELSDAKIDVRKLIKPKSLESSVNEVSEDRVTDMSEEYPEYREVFNNLKNFCATFPVEEGTLRQALIKCGRDKDTIKSDIDMLKDIGILKEYQRKKSDPIRYHIPDIYLKGMGLSRKGYR